MTHISLPGGAQALGLPLFMALFSFVGLAVTSATIVIFGQAITDPVQVLGRLKDPAAILISIFGGAPACTSSLILSLVRFEGGVRFITPVPA
jgi:cytosine/uracil/thiamine/allantoin permease